MNPPPWATPWQQTYYQPNPNIFIPPHPYHQSQPFVDSRLHGQSAPEFVSKKYPKLNPILAADTTLLRFDVKKKPRTEILASTYYSNRHTPATANGVVHIRLISKAFPWAIDVMGQTPVTCEAVWDALYVALQEPIADSEWGMIVASKKHREITEKAAKKRIEADPNCDKNQLRRIDYLGDTTLFKGLDKDDDFEKARLLPGAKGCPDTWVVRFG